MPSYLARYAHRLFAEVRTVTKADKVFVWSISAFGLLYVVLVGDFKVGKSLVSALYACLWAICIFAVYFSIKTCVHLRKEDLKRWADYVPTIPEYRPPRPSNAVGLLITTPIVAIAITAMIFSVIYVRTHRSLERLACILMRASCNSNERKCLGQKQY